MKCLRSLLFVGIQVLYSFSISNAHAQSASLCGEPPPVANETLKGEIKGKAQLLTKYLGDAQLSGKIETSRTEIFSKYPEAEKSRSNSYFEYQVCVLVMTDNTKSASQKLEALKDIRREFNKPVVKKLNIIIRSDKAIYDNKRWGPVDGSISTVDLNIDDKRLVHHELDKTFGSHKLELVAGDHTFEYVTKIYGAGANPAILEDNCQGTFSVTGSGTFMPRLKFERHGPDDLDGRITDCKLSSQ